MAKTLTVPVSLLQKMAVAADAFHSLEDELEGYLIAQNEPLVKKLQEAHKSHLKGHLKPFPKNEISS